MPIFRRSLLVLVGLLLVATGAQAQSVRSLGMGGAIVPGTASSTNPAYGAFEESRIDVPLPLGGISYLTRPEAFDPNSPDFDPVLIVDQLARLNEYLLNPATSPDDIRFQEVDINGQPGIEIVTTGGSQIALLQGAPYASGLDLALPLRFPVGPVTIGLRPYVMADVVWTPGPDFADLFDGGASSGSGSLALDADAGVALDVSYATEISAELPEFPGRLFVGATLSPFVSLARVQGEVTAEVTLLAGGGLDQDLDGILFMGGLPTGNVGFGARLDLGVATMIPTEQGTVYAGFAVQGLGYGFFNGEESTVTNGADLTPEISSPVAASRSGFLGMPDLVLMGAIDLDPALLGAGDELTSFMVAADAAYTGGGFAGHLGAEAGFGVEGFGTVYARGGGGYDSGLVFGVGAGARVDGGFGFDAAFHGRSSIVAEQMIYGLSAGVSFGL